MKYTSRQPDLFGSALLDWCQNNPDIMSEIRDALLAAYCELENLTPDDWMIVLEDDRNG